MFQYVSVIPGPAPGGVSARMACCWPYCVRCLEVEAESRTLWLWFEAWLPNVFDCGRSNLKKYCKKPKHMSHMGSLSPTIINNPRFSPRTLCPNILRPSETTSWCHSGPPSGTEKYSRQRLGKERLATSTGGIGIQGYDCHKKICLVHPEDCEKRLCKTWRYLFRWIRSCMFLSYSAAQVSNSSRRCPAEWKEMIHGYPLISRTCWGQTACGDASWAAPRLCANLPRVVPPGQVEIWRFGLPVVFVVLEIHCFKLRMPDKTRHQNTSTCICVYRYTFTYIYRQKYICI